MGVGAGVLSERARIFVGLDLGQSQDPTALSIVERAEVFPGEMDWVSYARRRPLRFRVLYLERMLLGTPYPRVVERVRQVLWRSAQQSKCTLVMDATGLGTPVLDMMRAANLGCEIVPVLLTGGERECCANGVSCLSQTNPRLLLLPKFPPIHAFFTMTRFLPTIYLSISRNQAL